MKVNDKGEYLVQHHVKYEELHGVDEIIMMTQREHLKLHQRLRKEGKCKVPVKELRKISAIARQRTESCKIAKAAYAKTEKCKSTQAIYRNTKQGKDMGTKYRKKNMKNITFYVSVDRGIYLLESIYFNLTTGNVSVINGIHHPKREIVFIDI